MYTRWIPNSDGLYVPFCAICRIYNCGITGHISGPDPWDAIDPRDGPPLWTPPAAAPTIAAAPLATAELSDTTDPVLIPYNGTLSQQLSQLFAQAVAAEGTTRQVIVAAQRRALILEGVRRLIEVIWNSFGHELEATWNQICEVITDINGRLDDLRAERMGRAGLP